MSNAAIKQKNSLIEEEIKEIETEQETNNEALQRDILEAETIYAHLMGKVSEEKLGEIRIKIDSLKSDLAERNLDKIEETKQETPHKEEFLEHQGTIITPPLFDDIYDDLDELDEKHNIPEKPTKEDIVLTHGKPHLLNIPPPPTKDL